MLDERFLARLSAQLPTFYERVNAESAAAARSLLEESRGDAHRAILRARLEGASRLWWPYVRGSIPVVGDDRHAMEQFTRIVLTIDHLLGYQPGGVEEAREQVVSVLRNSLDVERLARIAGRDGTKSGAATAAGAGFLASIAAAWAPIATVRRVAGAFKWLPPAAKWGIGAVILATLASVPIMAGYSASRNAERQARGTITGTAPPMATLEAPDGSRSYHSVAL